MSEALVLKLKDVLASVIENEITASDIADRLRVDIGLARDLMKEIVDEYYEINYIVGRKGYETRLSAAQPLNSIFAPKISVGNNHEKASKKPPTDLNSANPPHTITHCYVLRKEPMFEVRLPIDLSKDEADRLNAYISAICI
ncbi:MAG: hypothetical protein ACQRW7_00950 [Caulobacterales bacterium]|uniref:hypothetical protein n=1 Tax=Glycocaulis sp. TaxID=1969725 RepID=UPI003F9F8172